MMPLLASALIADGVAQVACKERLYHALAKGFLSPPGEVGDDSRRDGH